MGRGPVIPAVEARKAPATPQITAFFAALRHCSRQKTFLSQVSFPPKKRTIKGSIPGVSAPGMLPFPSHQNRTGRIPVRRSYPPQHSQQARHILQRLLIKVFGTSFLHNCPDFIGSFFLFIPCFSPFLAKHLFAHSVYPFPSGMTSIFRSLDWVFFFLYTE